MELREPDGFANLDDVISSQGLQRVASAYKAPLVSMHISHCCRSLAQVTDALHEALRPVAWATTQRILTGPAAWQESITFCASLRREGLSPDRFGTTRTCRQTDNSRGSTGCCSEEAPMPSRPS